MKKKKERRVYLPRVLGNGQVMMPADLKSDYGLFAPGCSVRNLWRAL